MFEAEKTNRVRGQAFLDTYVSGRVIDIGCGSDLVVPDAEAFDLDQGNANLIDEVREAESYDCVHASHCLEHMHDPVDALDRWWTLVRPGGYLVVVVPDENLYEQGIWPSRFNPDHKSTFRLNKEDTWSPCSHDLAALAGDLPGGEVISAEVQDFEYNYDLMRLEPENEGTTALRILLLSQFNHLLERNLLTLPLAAEINRFFHAFGVTIDQTYGPALAQLQVVVRKNPHENNENGDNENGENENEKSDRREHTPTIQQSLELAVQHHNAGDLFKAEGIYQQVLQAEPNQPVALHLLGMIASQVGKDDAAVELITKALAINPNYAEAHSNLGLVLQGLGQLDEAVASCHRALAIKPDYAEAHYILGNTLLNQGRLEDAIVSYHKALAIKPDFAEAHNNLGNTLLDLGRLTDAKASYQKAIAIQPDYAEAHNNLGNTLLDLGKLEDAIVSYHKALAIKPDFAEAHNNLGNTLLGQGRLEDAVVSLHKAIAIKPEYAEAHSNLGNAFKERGELKEAMACYQKALAIQPGLAEIHSNLIFSMSFIPEITNENIFEEARRWHAQHAYQGEIRDHQNTPEPDRRLRVGLVSGDFRRHSVSYFLKNILSEIDEEKIEIFAYATSGKEDDLTGHLKTIVSEWRKVTGLGDEQLVNDIIADGIDILIDLSGHTSHNRLKMFSYKPAPIQVAWLGYGGTTGMEAMDYVLCDSLVLSPSDEAYFVEKPWRLADIWVCFSPPDLDIDVGALPALANDHITFGSFNNLTKMTDRTVACWAKVLQAVPDSRLLLKAKPLDGAMVQEETRARFEVHGIARHRLTLKGPIPGLAEHLRTYNEIDIALDPFPYSGGTTTVEALWMGVPVLTLKGDRFVSHMGKSILQNVGLGAWVADTPEDYVEKTTAFASDRAELSALREGLRNRLLESPICDATRFAGNLEDAFRGMWRQWCAKKCT